MLRKFTTLCSPLPCVEEKALQLSQRSVMGVGKAKYIAQDSLHSICEFQKVVFTIAKFYALFDHNTVDQENSEHAVCVIASKSFAAVQTESGKVDILIIL